MVHSPGERDLRTIEALRADVRAIVQAGIDAVSPARCIPRAIRTERNTLIVRERSFDLSQIRRVVVVGAGKASSAMASAVENVLKTRIASGLVVTAPGYATPTERIEVCEAAHPVPDRRNVASAARVLRIAEDAEPDDLILVLLSGGGSALLSLPPPSISIDEYAEMTRLMLRSGLPIREVNVVRRHVSETAGGRLAAAAYPAETLTLIVSDVPGDELAAIASGPTVGDSTTFADAREILHRNGAWDRMAASVRGHLEAGVDGRLPESIRPENPRLSRTSNVVIASGPVAVREAQREAESRGFSVSVLDRPLVGEARVVGQWLGSHAAEDAARSDGRPRLLLAHGETTVTVRGSGRGGRNQEVCLAASKCISGIDGVVVCSVGTDGRDGPTDAAGAMVDGGTVERLSSTRRTVSGVLAANDSYTALHASGDLIVTGPTATNVADLMIIAWW